MEERPELTKDISIIDFRDFYWLKQELVMFCRTEGLNSTGGKLEIAGRIENYLKTGIKNCPTKIKPNSTFDWNSDELDEKTVITDNYSNTEKVRCFFKKNLGEKFKFNVEFMNWMKASEGSTLGDAMKQWELIRKNKKSNVKSKIIAPQFEFNNYIRDYLKDNPQKSKMEALKSWNIKKSMRGDNFYCKSDLDF